MRRYVLLLLIKSALCLNLDYLDPTKLQTISPTSVQQEAAQSIISTYLNGVTVYVNPTFFKNSKDTFALQSSNGTLQIRASTGVAAVWGFNYYLKKYCKSQIAWQESNVNIPSPLPEVDEVVVANDRFRYYQNVCTPSYTFVWWNVDSWKAHVAWMALNGINMALAPIAQEAAWIRVYKKIGMTDDEINEHFTGPAFLSWLRMGNLRGWGGPLPKSWHDKQKGIQDIVVDYMFRLGMIPVFPAFNGHVPKAFARIYPNKRFYNVDTWNKFESDYCCSLFLDPTDQLFKDIGRMFLTEITSWSGISHIYAADPFNEVYVKPWSTALVKNTAQAIYSTLSELDSKAVWLLQNWMFVHDPVQWPLSRVKTFLTSVPNGRMLLLDLQSEQWPQYDLYNMYYGQPFIWCMLHNFGGTLGMFGNMQTINKDVYDARKRLNSTMIGTGLTPEGINQNYVVYDLMLESAWRKEPVANLDAWIGDYAERRYGCNDTASAWRYLLKSVYSFNGLNRIRGKYVVTRQPSFKIRPWAWYSSHDLFTAFEKFVFTTNSACNTDGFNYDLVDVTRQALQYRAEQLYVNLQNTRFSNTWTFNSSISRFLDAMSDMESILATNNKFTANDWLSNARSISSDNHENYIYEMNARNQITLWGPNGEISDYACKQWAELFKYYYTPRWLTFLNIALDARRRNEFFDEKSAQNVVRMTVEEQFSTVSIDPSSGGDPKELALRLYEKWATVPGLDDLPLNVIVNDPTKRTTLSDVDSEESMDTPTVVMLHSTSPSAL